MRYRKLSPDGDYVFGHGNQDFLIDSPAAVAQAILTALRLFQGEWFLDNTAGVPWTTRVIGHNTTALYDIVIKTAILGVTGVNGIVQYSSTLDRVQRHLTVSAIVDTVFSGQAIVTTTLGFGQGGYGEGGFGG